MAGDYYLGHADDIAELIRAVDYVSVHTYPFHDTNYDSDFWKVPSAEQSLSLREQADNAMVRAKNKALNQFKAAQDNVRAVDSTKQMHIGETGWSSFSNELFGAGQTGAADEYKQKAYFDAMYNWADQYGASVFFFQSFDEPWKGDPDNSGHSEKHFGLIDIDGKAKYAIWDLVDSGAFEGITRGGKAITKSYGGDEAAVLNGILPIPYNFDTESPVQGDVYTITMVHSTALWPQTAGRKPLSLVTTRIAVN